MNFTILNMVRSVLALPRLVSYAVVALGVSIGSLGVTDAHAEEITLATVNNSDMIIMQKLSPQWEKKTGHKIKWVTLEENVLRQRVTTDIATGGGQFDVITIGAYETPIWGLNGWLTRLDDLGDDYDYEDIFLPVRNSLSANGIMYAVPFYSESAFTFYRKDLFDAAGLTMPDQPSYRQFREFAARLHDPDNGLYGVCLRGKAGWGENMAFVGILLNTFGARWFDMNWQPQLDSPEWHEALEFYVNLMNDYGPPGASSNGHNENRALFASGKCAMWIDATSAAGYIYDPKESKVADKTAFANAPIASVPRGNGWAWSWALAVPASSNKASTAKSFVKWATSQAYVETVGNQVGWVSAPPGTRKSTYANKKYIAAAPFAGFTRSAILSADPANATRDAVPYTGVQFVAIPEFQALGTQVGQYVAAALSGKSTVKEALQSSQQVAIRTMRQAGYIN